MSHILVLSDQQLQAFLDEELPAESMTSIELQLRDNPELGQRLSQLCGQRDAGMHSIGEIWRRHRISCPSRQKLGSYLLNALMDDERVYIKFHLETVGCRYCQSNVEDLQRVQAEAQSHAAARKRRYLQSSAGYLHREQGR